MVLFNHPTKDCTVQVGNWIVQLIFEQIETLQVKKVATLDDTNRGVGEFGSTRVKPLVLSPQSKHKKIQKKNNSPSPIPSSQQQ